MSCARVKIRSFFSRHTIHAQMVPSCILTSVVPDMLKINVLLSAQNTFLERFLLQSTGDSIPHLYLTPDMLCTEASLLL